MRKKSLIILLLVLLMSATVFACAGNKYKFDDYTDFSGGDNSIQFETDADMTLDGVLDEEAWANVNNKMSAVSSYSTDEEPLKMDVYTHFGEKALYFAFDVTDNTIFVNQSRKQSRNTGVELYLSALDNFTFGKGCISVRVTPWENGSEPSVTYWIPSGGNMWFQTKVAGKYKAGTRIDGKINERKGAKGYVVELAVSYDLIGGKTDAIQYTASFVQSRVLEREERLDNTFFKGTSYVSPGSWIGVTENSILAGDDKYSYLDANYVTPDADMNVDGKLDDEKWQEIITAGKGKTITHKSTGISLTTYALFGENGVYIGLDSNDPEVWYSPDRQTKYNTGAEIFVSALGATELTNDSAVQFRFAVGGGTLRYRANPSSQYPWTSSYFPAKVAGSVKNGGEFNKPVTGDYAGVDGWQGEIFIPWSAFGATTEEQKSQIAIFNCIYWSRSDAETPGSTEWKYLAPAGTEVTGAGSGGMNPQKTFFRFTKADGFVFGGVEVPDVVFFKGTDGTYKATVTPKYVDAVTSAGFETAIKPVTGGEFSVTGITGTQFTDNGDGTYTMTVPQSEAAKFEGGKVARFTLEDGVYADFTIEYVDIDSSKFDTSRVKAYVNFDGGIKNLVGDATAVVDRGTPSLVKYDTGSAINGYYAANMRRSSVKLATTVGTGSFVMSAMVNGTDVKNYFKTDTEGGYSMVLFGTGNVDGTKGFALQARRDNVFVRMPDGKRYDHANALTYISDGWQRWTFMVDRETEGKLTYTLYIDNQKVASKTIDLDSALSLDVENYNTVGIGIPGCKLDGDGSGNSYTDKSIGIDEFVYTTGTYSFGELLNMIAWVNEANAKYAFATDDVTFDFNAVTADGYTQQLRVTAYPDDGTVVDVTDVTFGAEIAPYITKADGADYFTLTIPADKVAEFKDGVVTTYTYNGVTKQFTVKYVALEALYLDATEVTAWKKNRVGDNYVFTVGVYGDADLTAMVKGASFGDWNDYSVDNGDGTYTFTVPASVVETLTAAKIVVVNKTDATSADFRFEYKYLTAEELAAVASATDVYYDFNGNIADKISGSTTAPVKGEAIYSDHDGENTALKVTCNTNTVGAAISLGAESFTMSFDSKIYSEHFSGNAGYELVTSTFDSDSNPGTFQFSVHGQNQVLRIQVGDNAGANHYFNDTKGKIKLDAWQRFTLVVERGLENDDETLETVKITLYIDGVKVQTKTRSMAKGQVLGNGTIYFGGNFNWSTKTSEIDNFTLVRKVLSDKEIEGLDSYYTEIVKAAGWHVDNVAFDFTEVTEGTPFTAFVNFTTNGSGANIFGATFTGLPEGVTITESISAPGTYTLTVPYDKLGSLKGGVTVTAKIGGVERKFTVKYVALEKLYLDTTSVSMWKSEKADGAYKFNIGVYADDEHAIALKGVTFDKWNEHATYAGNGIYAFSVPEATVEALTGIETVTASKDEAETAAFTFEYKYLTAEEIAAIASKTEAYIDFDGNVTDKIVNNASVTRGEVTYADGAKYAGDKYFAANQKNTSVKLATTLGTGSFTVSMLVNGADVRKYALDDYINGVPGAKAGYAFVLFGTGNVDGANGFSVRVRKDTVQVKVGGTNKGYSSAVSKITDSWQRWTVTFDRSTEGTVKYVVYIDGVAAITDSVAYDGSFDVSGYNTLGIGAPGCNLDGDGTGGGYTDKSIGLDDFTLVNRVLTAKEIEGLDSYYGEILEQVGWYVDNLSFDFADVATLGAGEAFTAPVNFTTNGSGAITAGATFTGLPEGVAINETAGVYTLSVPQDKIDDFKAGVTVTAKIGDVERTFTIKYYPLEKLYLDTTSVSMWKSEKADGAYKFNIGVYADDEHAIALKGVTFDKWNEHATYAGNGIYAFSVPEATVEALTGIETVTASKDEAETAAFTFEYKYLTAEEIAAIASKTEAYYDFNGNITDKIQGTATAPVKGEAIYSDHDGENTALKVTCKTNTVGATITPGTDSFTMSFDAKIYSEHFSGDAGYELVTSTGNDDGQPSTFQFSAHGKNEVLRIQVGRNDGNSYFNKTKGKLKLDQWQRFTLVVQRNAGRDEEHTTKAQRYNADGSYNGNASVTNSYSTPEKVLVTLYIDGVKIETVERWFSDGQSLGNGTIYFGGNLGRSTKTSEIDNFTFVRKALTDREIAALDSYYGEISAIAGWKVDDVTVKFDEVTAGEDKTVNLGIVKYAAGAITTGATFTGLPENVTIAETAGAYTLTIPYEKLGDLKAGVTVTAKVGVIERTFTVKYVPLDTLYASTVNFYEYEIDAGAAVTRTVKVSADAEGTVSIAGATFDNLPDGVTVAAGSTAGEYVLTVPAAKINELVASPATVTFDGVTANVTAVYNAAILKDTAVYSNIDTVSKKDGSNSGGKVFGGIDIGAGSFTVAMMADNLNKIGTGGGYILFSTCNTEVYKGITVYANGSGGNMGFRFRFAGMNNGFLKITYDITKHTDWTHLAFTFDRSVAGSVTITAYVNFKKVGSVTQPVTADETFTYGASQNFVVGSVNPEAWGDVTTTMTQTNQYNISAAGVTIYRGVAPIGAVQTYFDGYLGGMTIPADAVQAKFTFADGTTANSVEGSSVTMALNANATETVVDGKDGGDDKAVQINSKSAYYDVNGFDVSTGSFAVSMDLKMDFVNAGTSETYELTANGSGIILFATTDPDATSGMAVSIRKNTIRVRVNGEYKTVTIDTDNNLNKWTNIAVIFTRGNGKCVANVYVNNVYKGNAAFTVADNVSLAGTTAGYLGIGSGTAYQWATDVTHTIDNVTLKR